MVFNSGAAFGILKGSTNFLIYVGIIFILVLVMFLRKEKTKSKMLFTAYGLILGGAFSNMYDRIFLGYVVDYLDFRVWPVFNIADTCISTGVGLIFLQSFLEHRQAKNNAGKKDVASSG